MTLMHRSPPRVGPVRAGGFAALCIAGLAACATVDDALPPPVYLVADDLEVKVYHEPDIFFPTVFAARDENGRVQEVEAFPLVAGMAVARRDGRSLAPDDEPKAQEAAEYYCQQRGGNAGTGARASIIGSETYIWFFGGCGT